MTPRRGSDNGAPDTSGGRSGSAAQSAEQSKTAGSRSGTRTASTPAESGSATTAAAPSDFLALAENRLSFPLAVAEIGTAHGGDLVRGLELIDAAADSGAHVAKIQVVFADEILPPEAGLVPLPGGEVPLFDVFRSLQQPADFYAAMAERAAKRGIGFLASPFGEKSVRILEELGVNAWKVASPELNHEPLLERLARTGLPIILSTGVSTLEDIERALQVITEARRGIAAPIPPTSPPADFGGAESKHQASSGSHSASSASTAEHQENHAPPRPLSSAASAASGPSKPPLILLHCLTSYPAAENEANLRIIPTLRRSFGHPVGLSDHSLDPVLLPSLAVSLGAVMVEKHITLDKSAGGLDDPVALNPDDFSRMTAAMARFTGTDIRAAVKELAAEYGRERVEGCLGDGAKKPAASELPNYGRTNRSLHAVGSLSAGTILTPQNTALLRTEKVLRPGIEPRFRNEIYGKPLIRDVASGDGITWDDLALASKAAGK